SASNSGLHIPESKDGFFGYSEEKSLKQIEEKYWAQRRGSEVTSDAGGFKPLSQPGSVIGDAFHDEEEEKQFTAEVHAPEQIINAEQIQLLQQLQKCLELRDKYMFKSRQRLGDDPRDYDGHFEPLGDLYADVSGVRPDVPISDIKNGVKSQANSFNTWNIYPKPPPPHWHWKDKEIVSADGTKKAGDDEFILENCEIPGPLEGWSYEIDMKGVYQVYEIHRVHEGDNKPAFDIPDIREYFVDLEYVLGVIADGPTKSFAYRRLKYLSGKFTMYSLLSEFQELADMKKVPHRFYNVRKHESKHLLRFIKSKMKRSPDDVVIFRDGHELTLSQFNLKYNPIGESRLREIFLKTDNFIKGRYLAELTKELMTDLEQSKYQNVEWRISIYGRTGKWIINHKLYSHNVRWLIQVPRIYEVYKANGSIRTFEDIVISECFKPLFEVTKDPRSHPELHIFLQRVVGFDTVDDESKIERRIHKKFPYPKLWDLPQSPPYSYWLYYMFANMASLNNWRRIRGFNTFLSNIFLSQQIGIAMSPLSNNALFLTYERNPLPDFFKVGLNVSLSTDDPLQFHFTKEPLLEEYSVAAHIYKLPQSSLAELARNSMEMKRHWLGHDWYLPGAAGNDINKTNVPDSRLAYRHQTLVGELDMIRGKSNAVLSPLSQSPVPGSVRTGCCQLQKQLLRRLCPRPNSSRTFHHYLTTKTKLVDKSSWI
ncbi:AMP deaminase, partial [Pholiota molesta]